MTTLAQSIETMLSGKIGPQQSWRPDFRFIDYLYQSDQIGIDGGQQNAKTMFAQEPVPGHNSQKDSAR
jgi:hypothetical protein